MRRAELFFAARKRRHGLENVAKFLKPMNANRITLPALLALGGGFVFVVGMLLSAADFEGFSGDRYAITNHFISELGWKRISPSAHFFNGGLVICCLAYLPMMWRLGRQSRTRLGDVAMIPGFVMLGAGAAVGLLPLDYLKAHLIAAGIFFWFSLVTAVLFTLAFLPRWNRFPSRGIAVVGGIASMSFLSFLIFPKESAIRFLRDPEGFERPLFWGLVILEWSVLFSVYLWGLTAVFVLWFRERARGGQS